MKQLFTKLDFQSNSNSIFFQALNDDLYDNCAEFEKNKLVSLDYIHTPEHLSSRCLGTW